MIAAAIDATIVVLKSVMALTGVERSAEVTDGVRTVETLHAKIVVIPDAEMIDERRIAVVMVDATRWAAITAIGAEDLAMTHCWTRDRSCRRVGYV